MKLINKSKLLAAVCIADLLLLGGLIHTVRGEMPAHVSADEGSWVREGGDTLDRAKGLEGKCVALTFDDGPNEDCTEKLLDGLKERNVRATFFLMGQNIEGNEEIVKRMKAEGHLIGNHSYSHVQLTKAGSDAVCQAVDRTSRMIEEITGERPQYMRPPYGDWNEELECRVGMTTVLWSVDSLDWKLRNTNRVVKRVLKDVEDGTLILIGATTENPYFEVNGALLSRSRIFELKPLEKDDVKELIRRAVYDKERGMGIYDADIDEDAADFLADTANGDARAALNAVELGVLTTAKGADGRIHIDMAVAQECIQKRAVRYDKNGDNHYDTISAFIKSMRGSDPDAAVYYLARMLYAGEDIKFIARRIMICAAEDVGNADPQALVVAVNAAQAAERIGIPEANIILSQAVTYVATAPKSNAACMAVQKAMEAVRNERTMPVPVHLQDKHYKGAEKLGHGAGYLYAHDYPKHYVQQQYLPEGMEGTVFYEPSDNGYEKQINAHMKWLKS